VTLRTVSRIEVGTVLLCNRGNSLLRVRCERQSCDTSNYCNEVSPPHRSERWLDKRIEQKGLRPRDAAYVIGAFWTIAVVAFGVVERLVDPKTFHSIWLGMWWAVETVTTVGYGDIVPNQTAGKIIACFLMLGGLSLLSVVTAAITSGFVSRSEARRRAAGEDPVMQKLDDLAAELRNVKAKLEQLQPGGGGAEDSA